MGQTGQMSLSNLVPLIRCFHNCTFHNHASKYIQVSYSLEENRLFVCWYRSTETVLRDESEAAGSSDGAAKQREICVALVASLSVYHRAHT